MKEIGAVVAECVLPITRLLALNGEAQFMLVPVSLSGFIKNTGCNIMCIESNRNLIYLPMKVKFCGGVRCWHDAATRLVAPEPSQRATQRRFHADVTDPLIDSTRVHGPPSVAGIRVMLRNGAYARSWQKCTEDGSHQDAESNRDSSSKYLNRKIL